MTAPKWLGRWYAFMTRTPGAGWPAWITAVLVFTLLRPERALRDAPGLAVSAGAMLDRSPLYVALAPLSDVLDALTLLSIPQLITMAVSLILYYALWRIVRWRRRGTSGWCEFCSGLRALLIFSLVVILAAVLPRPMAAIRMNDPDAVVFDIHSHTNFSHDARSTFTVEDNRAWHAAAGFDVAYITDHRCFDGAAEGMRANPKRAGEGTVLLSGIEFPADQRHEVVLEPPDAAVPPKLLENWCVRATAGRTLARPPVRIQTIPEDLARIRVATQEPDSSVIAIEVSDGAPRGIAQAQRDEDLIWHLVSTYRLAPVAGSNNHGWGRTAVAWNVMRVPGWRSLTPDSLGAVIEMRLKAEREHAVRVIERTSVVWAPGRANQVILTLSMPLLMVFQIIDSMSGPERLSWLVWTWGITGIVVLVRRRRAQ